jgi:N6-adenosine-specific RNA methylase IME4
MTELVKYDAARRAIAEAKAVDEAKDIRDWAVAMAAYARQAKNHDMEADAIEIRLRATRKIDQLRQAQKETVGLNQGASGGGEKDGPRGLLTNPRDTRPTLASQGIDKNLAHQARTLGAMTEEKFEEVVCDAREAVSRTVRHVVGQDTKAERRAEREIELAAKQTALPDKRYGVIYADPEWRFEVYSRKTGMDLTADNHYPTSPTEEICNRPVGDIAADDCVLFLWATVPMLPDALKVMSAWGFTYKSQFAWAKNRAGTGYWNRNRHELLLIGTKGNIPCPAPGTQWDSLVEAAVGRHSEKPEKFYELIESYFPNLPKIELNARRARPGWDAWGNEVMEAAQ